MDTTARVRNRKQVKDHTATLLPTIGTFGTQFRCSSRRWSGVVIRFVAGPVLLSVRFCPAGSSHPMFGFPGYLFPPPLRPFIFSMNLFLLHDFYRIHL